MGMQNFFQRIDKKKFLWGLIIIIVIVGIFWLIFSLRNSAIEPDIYSTDNQPVFGTNSPKFEQPADISPEENTAFTVNNLSRTFAERFGSWSTDNPGQNLADLNVLVSANLKAELANLASYQERDFYGVTTNAISSKIQSLDEEAGEATVLVGTQRIITESSLTQHTEYQDLLVFLIFNNNTWLVNQAEWQ